MAGSVKAGAKSPQLVVVVWVVIHASRKAEDRRLVQLTRQTLGIRFGNLSVLKTLPGDMLDCVCKRGHRVKLLAVDAMKQDGRNPCPKCRSVMSLKQRAKAAAKRRWKLN